MYVNAKMRITLGKPSAAKLDIVSKVYKYYNEGTRMVIPVLPKLTFMIFLKRTLIKENAQRM